MIANEGEKTMACQCGCCDTPAPEGKDALEVVQVDSAKADLQRQVEELDRRVKDLETAA
jgi:hypothetical protein